MPQDMSAVSAYNAHMLSSAGVAVTDFEHSRVSRKASADLLVVFHLMHPSYLGRKPLKKASDYHPVFMPRDSPHAVTTPSPTIKLFMPARVAQDTALLVPGEVCITQGKASTSAVVLCATGWYTF